jgi:hypothetical protein
MSTLGTSAPQERTTNWAAIGFGVGLVVVVVLLVWLFSRGGGAQTRGPNPYAASIKFSDLKMSTAQNFVGANVTYVEGTVANGGSQTVTHIDVQPVFRNSMNEVVGNEIVPLMVTAQRPGYSDTVDLSQSPLKPGQSRQFRLTFEHISADWNQQYPEIKIVDVRTR